MKNWSLKKKILIGLGLVLIISIGLNQNNSSENKSSDSIEKVEKKSKPKKISLYRATSIAKKKCEGSGQCMFCDVYRKVENQRGNYGILLSCGGGPTDFLMYEISKQGEILSAEFTN